MKKFKVAYVFSDGCVLQRRKPIAVFGQGLDGEKVTVTLGDDSAGTLVSEGKWKVCLNPREAENNLTLNIMHGEDVISFKDVSVGEVWLAGGQSNMEFELQNAVMGREMLKNDHPNVRFYNAPRISWEDGETVKELERSHWTYFSSEEAAGWSAVGYMFGRRISEELGVTVGIIGCNFGGTSASCWIPEADVAAGWDDTRTYITDYYSGLKDKPLELQKKEYEDYEKYRSEWLPKCEALYASDPTIDFSEVERIIGPSYYPGPMNAFNPLRPFGLYETMLKKVIEYSLAGVIYYQGESDDHKPDAYFNLFQMLISRWRYDNGDRNLPFIAVSLPMHRYRNDPDYKNWPVIRNNQRKAIKNNHHTGLCVAVDCGQFDNIHPTDKRAVSERLALQALWKVYGVVSESDANGPVAYSVKYDRDAAYVSFLYADDGFYIDDSGRDYPDPLNLNLINAQGNEKAVSGFEIAPMKADVKDSDYVKAEIEIIGNKIKIYSDKVTNPGYIRYLWTNWGKVTLYGRNGIPVEPFRA